LDKDERSGHVTLSRNKDGEAALEEIPIGELCRQILQACNDAIIYSDPDGTIRFWNSGAEQMLGFSADEAIGRSLDIFIPEKQRTRPGNGTSG
jgi:PAS domain-containing protein